MRHKLRKHVKDVFLKKHFFLTHSFNCLKPDAFENIHGSNRVATFASDPTSAASATTSSSRSRLSPIAPPPPFPLPPRAFLTACRADRLTTTRPPTRPPASLPERRISTARRSVRTRCAKRPLRPFVVRPLGRGPPPSIQSSLFTPQLSLNSSVLSVTTNS